MRFLMVAFLAVAMSAAYAAEPPSVRIGKVDGLKHLVIDPNTGVVFASGKQGHFAVDDDRTLKGPVDIPHVAPVPTNGIPHGRVVEGNNHIRRAWLTRPTQRYDHGVLGDDIEASGFWVDLADGRSMEYQLGPQYVFEDLEPRLADMDGDGLDEIILARSSLTEGAAVSVYRVGERQIEQFAVSPSIGLAYRWLNPIGAADFDADGEMDVAVVETPHLGKTLVIYGREASRLKSTGRLGGFSSHFIGSTVLRMTAVVDLNGDGVQDIVVPDAPRRRLIGVTFRGREFKIIWEGGDGAPITTEIVTSDIDGNHVPDILYGRENGVVEAILR